MATLTGNTIASTYTGLLSVTGSVGADTVEAVTDGAGTSTSLSLSQQRATITLGSGAADDFIVDGTTFVVEGDNNRVGIGTASPSYKLHVADDTANDYAAYIINDNADGSGLRLRCDDSDGDEYLFYAENSTTARFAIKSDGKTGIGTASPTGKLHVLSGASGQGSPDITELVVEGSGNTGISILTPNDQQGEIAFGDPQDANIGRFAYNHGGNYLATVVNGSEAMRIESDITVVMKGATQFEGNTTVTANNARFGVGASASGHWASGFDVLSVGHATQIACETADSGDRNAFWTSNIYYDGTGAGNSVYRRLYTDEASMIQQRAGFIAFFTDASGTADADFEPTERMRITSGGNVGIGTNNPTEKLTVTGGDILVDSARGVRASGGNEMIRFSNSDGVKINSGGKHVLSFKRDSSILHHSGGTNVGMELYKQATGSSANLLFTVALNNAGSLYHLTVCEIIIAHIGNANPRLISQYIWEIENHNSFASDLPAVQTPVNLGGDDQSITVATPSADTATFQINGQGSSTTNIAAYFRVVSGVTGVSSLT